MFTSLRVQNPFSFPSTRESGEKARDQAGYKLGRGENRQSSKKKVKIRIEAVEIDFKN